MSDATLRELERAWRVSGDPADEARWHQARVRAGELAPWAWELVELLRRPLPAPIRTGLVSRLLTRAAPSPGEAERDRLREVFAALARESPAGYDRALVSAGEHALQGTEQQVVVRRDLQVAVDELAARLLSPVSAETVAPPAPALAHVWSGCMLLGLHARLRGEDPGSSWIDAPPLPTLGYGPAAAPLPAAGTCAALARALVPWLLALGDPLRAQAERALDGVRVASACDVPWEAMQGDERARRCGQCRMTVYDLSALDRAEAAALLRRHEGQRVCINFYRREDGRIQTRDCPNRPMNLAGHMVRGRRA